MVSISRPAGSAIYAFATAMLLQVLLPCRFVLLTLLPQAAQHPVCAVPLSSFSLACNSHSMHPCHRAQQLRLPLHVTKASPAPRMSPQIAISNSIFDGNSATMGAALYVGRGMRCQAGWGGCFNVAVDEATVMTGMMGW